MKRTDADKCALLLKISHSGAAALARAKFAGSNLPAMIAGCLLMLLPVVLHVLLLAR